MYDGFFCEAQASVQVSGRFIAAEDFHRLLAFLHPGEGIFSQRSANTPALPVGADIKPCQFVLGEGGKAYGGTYVRAPASHNRVA